MSDFDAFVKKYEPMLQAMLPEYERHKVEIDRRAAEKLAAEKAEPFDDGVTDENRAEIYAPLVAEAPELPAFVPEPEKVPQPEFKMAPEPGGDPAAAPRDPGADAARAPLAGDPAAAQEPLAGAEATEAAAETAQAAPGAPQGEAAAAEPHPDKAG